LLVAIITTRCSSAKRIESKLCSSERHSKVTAAAITQCNASHIIKAGSHVVPTLSLLLVAIDVHQVVFEDVGAGQHGIVKAQIVRLVTFVTRQHNAAEQQNNATP
jgi:hypothetical protein